jgi:2-keto-4-pentenoate hydratase/2-oxohepta-3-ene-1,7-dioic acid hydratase in catechol pathway
MRLCRFVQPGSGGRPQVGFFLDNERVAPLSAVTARHADATHQRLALEEPDGAEITAFLPPAGRAYGAARQLAEWLERNLEGQSAALLQRGGYELLSPLARPGKVLCLAGNYAKHIEEGGGTAVARQQTFPWVFMKPLTTLNHPDAPVALPSVSPDHIDWECELGVVIAKRCRAVKEAEALGYVGGYVVVNDISDREFRPNPGRKPRERDAFFDWLHGKWHDGFCPIGPCLTTSDEIPNPQTLRLTLTVNGAMKQNASTAQMIFPVAAVVEFISSFVTLEPGDLIATGTPDGTGSASRTFLKAGDKVEAAIERIGVLRNSIVAEPRRG